MLPPSPAIMRHPKSPAVLVSEANREQGLSSLPGSNRHGVSRLPPPPGSEETAFPLSTGVVSEETSEVPGLSLSPSLTRPLLSTLLMISWRPRREQEQGIPPTHSQNNISRGLVGNRNSHPHQQ